MVRVKYGIHQGIENFLGVCRGNVLLVPKMIAGLKPTTIFDVAHHVDSLAGAHVGALKRIFAISGKRASCGVGKELASKYKLPQNNEQYLVSITNRFTLEQTWFNEARTQKPQTFTQGSEFVDPTNGGVTCDFCRWPDLTACDPGFGRVELPHAVTGSNLFKYAGVVDSYADLSHEYNPSATEPFLLWNCLPRAGASQYHGHAQVMLTEQPTPGVVRLQQAADAYQRQHSKHLYFTDLLKAHAALGLTRQITVASAAAALPAENAAQAGEGFWGAHGPVVARIVSRGKLTSVASDFGCLEVFGGASIGHTDPFVIVKQLDEQLAAMAGSS
eukprot:gene11764-11909_t